MNTLLDLLGKKLLFFDGGTGTLLQQRGLKPGELPELWNIEHPEEIVSLHLQYLNAGCNIIKTNTFGANALKFGSQFRLPSVERIVHSAVDNAQEAISRTKINQPHFVALDIGPSGRLLKPLGDFAFEEAIALFAQVVKAGVKCGVDLILIETMNDMYETKAALLAAKENSNLPVFVTNAYDLSQKLMTGATPEAMCAMLEGMGATAIGANCSYGPEQMLAIVKRLAVCSSLPIVINPNAGLPGIRDGQTVYDVDAKRFATYMHDIAIAGAQILGGCCGTTPEYIQRLTQNLKDFVPTPIIEKKQTVIASYTHTVSFGKQPVLIGERINPTGKKLFKEALRKHDIDYLLKIGIAQQDAGVAVLDVNVGLPEIDECTMMADSVTALQAVTDLPLQIDSTDVKTLEIAMRLYNGKPLVNSVNGKAAVMDSVFPLIKKYGGVVVALTLDENGIPDTAEGRVKVAEKIIMRAKEYGIAAKNIIVDTLAMTISVDNNSANITLDALKKIHDLGIATSLGVSNISFGLPNRDFINAAFFTMALNCGLSAAIINPHSVEIMKAYKAYMALGGFDADCKNYIEYAATISVNTQIQKTSATQDVTADSLTKAIMKGLRDSAFLQATALLEKGTLPLTVINEKIVPALDEVGKGFEEKRIYLPQLLMSAEAAQSAFEAVKQKIAQSGSASNKKCTVVLATVQGDIHDIGKNIVKVLLENYGFDVVDLGKDVPPQKIADTVLELNAPLIGLSALMTTTVPSMEKTIELVHQISPKSKIAVGGAVLTKEYAEKICADCYCADAMETIRYAEKVNTLVK